MTCPVVDMRGFLTSRFSSRSRSVTVLAELVPRQHVATAKHSTRLIRLTATSWSMKRESWIRKCMSPI